jgi:hypothetical protein
MPGDELAALSLNEFSWLVQGLSEHSRFAHAWNSQPKRLYDPADRASVRAAALR